MGGNSLIDRTKSVAAIFIALILKIIIAVSYFVTFLQSTTLECSEYPFKGEKILVLTSIEKIHSDIQSLLTRLSSKTSLTVNLS